MLDSRGVMQWHYLYLYLRNAQNNQNLYLDMNPKWAGLT